MTRDEKFYTGFMLGALLLGVGYAAYLGFCLIGNWAPVCIQP